MSDQVPLYYSTTCVTDLTSFEYVDVFLQHSVPVFLQESLHLVLHPVSEVDDNEGSV